MTELIKKIQARIKEASKGRIRKAKFWEEVLKGESETCREGGIHQLMQVDYASVGLEADHIKTILKQGIYLHLQWKG